MHNHVLILLSLKIILYSLSFIIFQIIFIKKYPTSKPYDEDFLWTCIYTGGCPPKYLWVSYINASLHAISRVQTPFSKLVGSKKSVLHALRREDY